MNSMKLSDEMYDSAMESWNTLTSLMEPGEKLFDSQVEFRSFFNLVMDKLHTEGADE